MKRNISLNPSYFQFTLFSDYGPLRYLFFSLCLLVYATIVSANVIIILVVCLERSLHQPMYIFICCLCFNALYGSAGFFPRFLVDLLSDTHLVSLPSCFTQIYVIYSYLGQELTLLTVMAYDRFVAICRPLHYHSRMSPRVVVVLVLVAVLYPAFNVGACIRMVSSLSFCRTKLDRLLCTSWPVVQLSCADTTTMNAMGGVSSVVSVLVPLSFVLFTYLRILLVCRRSSRALRGKALQTCLPHILTFVNYCVSVFCEFSLTRYKATNTTVIVVLSLECLMVPPLTNPLVYCLNLPQIRGVVFRRPRILQQQGQHESKV